jgi:hypothetical protein
METVFMTRNANENKIHLAMAFKQPKGDYIMNGCFYTKETFNTVEKAESFCLNHNLKIVY